jgi:ATP-dependent DNA ligase
MASSRRSSAPYAGATKRITLKDAAGLGSRFAVQPKKDGIYVRVYLDGRGRVAKLFMRNGREVLPHLTTHLMGALVGNPHAELVGELEAMTDKGEAAARHGPRLVHLFDCTHDGSRSLVRAPYSERRAALWTMQSAVQNYRPDDDHRPKPYRRYRDPVLPGWKLTPIVPQVPIDQACRAWEEWVVGPDEGDEGLVIVALDAPVGRGASKMRIKQSETIDAVVVQVARTILVCRYRGSLFSVYRGKHHAEVGEAVEVRCDGYYETGVLPRFPAIVRVRRELQ